MGSYPNIQFNAKVGTVLVVSQERFSVFVVWSELFSVV